jgi:hypothetical protein
MANVSILSGGHEKQCSLITIIENSHIVRFVAFKGIVSRDFSVLFLISLNKYEPPDRAGSGLFFILITFSHLNF